jgi:hypothetical protein
VNKKQEIALLVTLLVVGGAIWAWQYLPTSGGSKANSASFLHGYQPLNFPNPDLHWSVKDRRQKAEYKASGINPFSHEVPPSPADIKKVADEQQKIADAHKNDPPLPPPPPELPANMKFFGYGTVPNGTPRRAFLSYQDDVYIVGEGDTLMGRYRILKINNVSLEFEEVGSGRRGQKMLEDQGPNA